MTEQRAAVADGVARLRAAGERLTPGRRAVLEVLDADARHLDADAIAAQVAVIEPGVHRATVYRSLQTLVDIGVVTHTHVPGGATIYHLSGASDPVSGGDGDRGGLRHGGSGEHGHHAHGHAHLQCVTCGRFTDLDVAECEAFVERVLAVTGFAVDPTHGALLGVCEACRSAAASR